MYSMQNADIKELLALTALVQVQGDLGVPSKKSTPMTPIMILSESFSFFRKMVSTLVGDYINTIKTTFDLKFDLYQAVKQHGDTKTLKSREAVNQKKLLFDYL